MKFAPFIALLAVLFVAGCSQHSSVSDPAYMQDHANHMQHKVVSEESFIADMIPHHQEAVDTSARLADITQNAAIKELTQSIVAGQSAEMAMMQ